MKKSISITLLTAVIFALLLIPVPVIAEQSISSGVLDDLGFDEYMNLIIAIAETEEHPHYLTENSQRYEEYRSKNPNTPFGKVIAYVNVNIDKGHYIEIKPVADPNKITVLVNKNFYLPSNWVPDDFIDIGGGHLMREEAAGQFTQMREAMHEASLNLNVIVTYRSYTRQENHFNNAVERSGEAVAEAGFARPGHSEHQTGLTIDVLHKSHDGGLMINMGFEQSKQFDWLVKNAHEYGFILRYPNGYKSLSGFIYEPWHWRYVGIPVATAMYEEGIVLYEEFYGRYLVQGVQDKVHAYLLEQQALAEAAEAAARAEAEAAAAAAAAAEAAELAAQEEAEKGRIAAELMEAARKAAEAKMTEQEAALPEMPSGNRQFLEGIIAIGVVIISIFVFVIRKK